MKRRRKTKPEMNAIRYTWRWRGLARRMGRDPRTAQIYAALRGGVGWLKRVGA